MTHPILLKFMGVKKMYSWIMFHLIPYGCKIVFNLEIIFLLKWHNLEKLKLLINILKRPIKWKVVKIFAKSTLKKLLRGK